jgi:hypothetical protein
VAGGKADGERKTSTGNWKALDATFGNGHLLANLGDSH